MWGSTFKTHLYPLTIAHKRLLRTITFSGKYAHTDPLYRQTQILKLEQLNKLCVAQFVFKVINDTIHSKIVYTFVSSIHEFPLRDPLRLRPPRASSQRQKSVVSHGCRIWNALSNEVKNSQSISIFKRRIKVSFFN